MRFALRYGVRVVALAVAASVAVTGCSVRQLAVNMLGDAVAGGSAYESDADIELVGDALPFSAKLLDSLVAESPRHRGLLLAAARSYLLYGYAYVHFDAERLADDDLDSARALRARAQGLYLRAFDYAMRGLELEAPDFRDRLAADPGAAARAVGRAGSETDVALLYVGAASLGLAISAARHDAGMLARLPEVEALLGRALALDEAWNHGALHEFAVTFSAARPGMRDRTAIDRHYARALALSRGRRAGVFVAYAEAMAVPAQDRAAFENLLDQALAVDLDADPDARLLNALAQRRARWLRSRADHLFAQ